MLQARVSASGARLMALAILLGPCPVAATDSDELLADGFELPCPGAAPGVVTGAGSALLLRGTIVTPTVAFAGEVLVDGDVIVCAAVSCGGQPGADTATVVETGALIYPGLIDSWGTALFRAFDATDWSPAQSYSNSGEWPSDARYGALVYAKQYLNGEGSPIDDGCELEKYGEIGALFAGTTSIVATPGSRTCYATLARTIDTIQNDLGADRIQTATLFPTKTAGDAVCANFASDTTRAYLVDVAEGTDATALNEFAKLGTLTTAPGCLYAPQTAIVHGTALGATEYDVMASSSMSLVWTPRSDTTLYGAGANVPLARSKGINVALATNWPITGSHDLLGELRFADQVDAENWGDSLSAYDLVQMVTTQAAKTLALDDVLGSIAEGKKADLAVVRGYCTSPWSSLLRAHSRDVRLVLVGGVPLYGDASLQAAAPATPGCETLDVCGATKFACVAESGGTVSNKFGQTLSEITATLDSDLTTYDALNLTQWKFAPLAPLVQCP